MRTVSIHARTRRATRTDNSKLSADNVSIHARTRRATQATYRNTPYRPVSIHARTRRATSNNLATLSAPAFQSTPAHGGRRGFVWTSKTHAGFQSTPAHGGRRVQTLRLFPAPLFQSTPAHGGRRWFDCACIYDLPVSIHARTRRATANALTSFHKSSKRQNSANLTHSSNLHGGIFLRNSLFTCQRSTYKNREPPCLFMVTCLSRCPFTQSAAPAGHRSA